MNHMILEEKVESFYRRKTGFTGRVLSVYEQVFNTERLEERESSFKLVKLQKTFNKQEMNA